jgi:hypothetical protein
MGAWRNCVQAALLVAAAVLAVAEAAGGAGG